MSCSPVVRQVLDGIKPLEVPSDRTDIFRQQVADAQVKQQDLAKARDAAKSDKQAGQAAVAAIRQSLGLLDAVEPGVLIDLLLSYRAVGDWQGMINLANDMPEPLRSTVMVQEQLGFALNRAGRSEEAERVLKKLIAARGPSSETLGILGRVYKDRWEAATKAGETIKARGLLGKAIDAYRRGFESDWRDHYPGVNAVTLMELKEPPDPERLKMIPVVRYSVERRTADEKADYWDWATLVELAVLAKDEAGAADALGHALAAAREPWEPESTARNLRLIREARERRGETVPWARELEKALLTSGVGQQ
jgi:tetratricopeptide (TPR) repeat protein